MCGIFSPRLSSSRGSSGEVLKISSRVSAIALAFSYVVYTVPVLLSSIGSVLSVVSELSGISIVIEVLFFVCVRQ